MEYLFLGKSDLTMFEALVTDGATAPEYLCMLIPVGTKY
jgi:hypothetical protein